MTIHKLKWSWCLKTTEDRLHSDGGNLFLQVGNDGAAKSWIFRYTDRRTKKKILMELGSMQTIDIAEARKRADAYRVLLNDGKDPKTERDGAKLDAEIAAGRTKTVREVRDEWERAKLSKRSVHTRRAVRTVDRYVIPKIGDMPIQKVDSKIILDTVGLRRLWMERNPIHRSPA